MLYFSAMGAGALVFFNEKASLSDPRGGTPCREAADPYLQGCSIDGPYVTSINTTAMHQKFIVNDMGR
jgi:hypothetical protein